MKLSKIITHGLLMLSVAALLVPGPVYASEKTEDINSEKHIESAEYLENELSLTQTETDVQEIENVFPNTVHVVFKEFYDMDEEEVGGTVKPVIFRFVPERTAEYTFEDRGDSEDYEHNDHYEHDVILINDKNQIVYGTHLWTQTCFKVKYKLTAGNVYYLQTGSDANELISYDVLITSDFMQKPLNITYQPRDVYAFSGEKVYFGVRATGGKLTYQWQYSKDEGATWVNSTAASAKTSNLSTTIQSDKWDGRLYRCVITDDYGVTKTSEAACLTILPLHCKTLPTTVPNTISDTVYKDEISGWYKFIPEQTAKYTFEGKGSGLIGFELNDEKGHNIDSWEPDDYSGYFKLSATLNAGTVYCMEVVNYAYKPITFTMDITSDYTNSKPVISSQPEDVTAVKGDQITYSVGASGYRLQYQWQYSKDGGNSWVDSTLKSGKTSTIKTTILGNSWDGRLYRCVITDGSGQQIISENAGLIVLIPLAITSQPTDVTTTNGTAIKFSVSATGNNLSYQWQYSKDGGESWIPSANTSGKTKTLKTTVKTSFSGRLYRCVITDGAGEQLISESVTLTVE